MELVNWAKDNYVNILMLLSALVAVGEIIVRFTPTQSDDGFVHRIGAYVDKLLNFAKVPNIRKKDE